ncbi:hypothetical protein [Saccharospirillum impatiens]|uniref:hypothetical protein n=1 Tax=Saccharospirillum impatiens TaxID=169438 RepID=UPI00041F1064|nr:hypothetical protein [Saccharospirillum impatiens]
MPAAANPRLPVVASITQSLGYCIDRARTLLVLVLPFLVLQYVLVQFTKPSFEYLPILMWQYWLVVGISLLMGVVVAVSIHRQFLQSPERQMPIRWGRAETRYAWAMLKLTLILILPVVFYVLIVVGLLAAAFSNWNIETFSVEQPLLALPVIWFCVLPIWYLWVRMTLVLPSAAIDQQPAVGISDSMELTSGNGWRMVAVTAGPLFAGGMLDTLLQVSIPPAIYWWLQPLLTCAMTVLGVVLVSVSFKQLYNANPVQPESTEGHPA